MNAVERTTAVLKGKVPDRAPVALHNYLMACHLYGGPLDRLLRDGELLAETQLAAWRQFGHDVIMIENGVCASAEALGAQIRYQSDQPPHVETPLIKKPEDLDKLQAPDPEHTFPLSELIKATRIVRRETNGAAFINGRSDQGPIALASALCGPETLLTWLMEPEREGWIRRLLDLCHRVNTVLGQAQIRAGAHSTTIGLAGTSLISPELFRAFELEPSRAFCRAVHQAGGFAFVHACGDEAHLLPDLMATEADCLELDPGTDPSFCKQSVQGRTSVLGMMDPVQVMYAGTPADVQAQARRMLRIMGPEGGFLIGPGCALPADTPAENVMALIELVAREGVYGADGMLRLP